MMDTTQLQAAIEQFLNFVQSQGPGAMQTLVALLDAIQRGANSVGSVATLIAHYPVLSQVIGKLILLITSGASIPEIAAAIAEFSASLGVSAEAVINLLYLLGGLLMLF